MKKFFASVLSIVICAAILVGACFILYRGGYLNQILSNNSVPFLDNIASALPQFDTTNKTSPIKDGALTAKEIQIDANAAVGNYLPVTKKMAEAVHYSYLPQQGGLSDMKTTQMQNLYHLLVKNAYAISQKKNDKGYYCIEQVKMKNVKLDESEIRITISAFKNDNPQIFWTANAYSYAYQGKDTIVQLYSYSSADECSRMIVQLNAKVSKIVAALPAKLSEFDRELLLYDKLAQNCSYDDAAAKDSSLWKSYTAVGALTDGKAVCEGYSRAMQLLLCYANMQCRLVNGEGQSALHMWNLVRVNGAWYHLDATWNDDDQMVRHDYFNLTDATILADHKISPQISTLTKAEINGNNGSQDAIYNLSLPVCTSTQANYFRVKGIAIQSFTDSSDKSVIAALAAAAQRHDGYVSFYIGTNLNYSDAIDQIFRNSPYKFLYYVKGANKAVANKNRINYSQTVYVQAKTSRGVTIKLGYQT